MNLTQTFSALRNTYKQRYKRIISSIEQGDSLLRFQLKLHQIAWRSHHPKAMQTWCRFLRQDLQSPVQDPTVCEQQQLPLLLPTVEPGGSGDGKMSEDFQSWPSNMSNYWLKDAISNTADDTSARPLKILILPPASPERRSGRPRSGYAGKSSFQGHQWCFCNYCRTWILTAAPRLAVYWQQWMSMGTSSKD